MYPCSRINYELMELQGFRSSARWLEPIKRSEILVCATISCGIVGRD
jgi:hypothetical protein